MVPHEATVLMAARTDRPVPVADSRQLAADNLVDAPDGERVKVIYRVKRGDTLSSIASVFRTTVASLKSWNRLPSSRIAAGTRLTIYTARAN
jgi:LysM repeat protein